MQSKGMPERGASNAAQNMAVHQHMYKVSK